MVQQMHGAANLERSRRGEELALRVYVTPRKEIGQADQRRRHKGNHGGSVNGGCERQLNVADHLMSASRVPGHAGKCLSCYSAVCLVKLPEFAKILEFALVPR